MDRGAATSLTRYAHSYVEVDFLNLAQAIEVFHRRTRPGGVLSRADHDERSHHVLIVWASLGTGPTELPRRPVQAGRPS